jgi:hypothetical protein
MFESRIVALANIVFHSKTGQRNSQNGYYSAVELIAGSIAPGCIFFNKTAAAGFSRAEKRKALGEFAAVAEQNCPPHDFDNRAGCVALSPHKETKRRVAVLDCVSGTQK